MSALLWWLIPLGATLVALGWAAARSRPRRAADTHETLGHMARFRDAMDKPLPRTQRTRPPGSRPRTSRSPRSRRPVERRHPA